MDAKADRSSLHIVAVGKGWNSRVRLPSIVSVNPSKFRAGRRRTPYWAKITRRLKRHKTRWSQLGLSATLERIPSRMSATLIAATTEAAGTLGKLLGGGRPGLFFSTMIEDEAKELARGLKQRDPDVLDRLIEQYQYRLFRYLVHLTGSRERAEDFFQETWVRVLERGHQYQGKWKFETWLFAIARNLVIDWQRRKKPASLDSLAGPEEDAAFDVKDEKSATPLESYLNAEQREGMHASLGK